MLQTFWAVKELNPFNKTHVDPIGKLQETAF